MKLHNYTRHCTVLAMFVLLSFGIGHAQVGTRSTIPFNFMIGTQSFPAGEYTFSPLGSFQHIVLLQDTTGKGSVMVLTGFADIRATSSSTRLVFIRYGEQNFLSQIWVEGNEFGKQLARSPIEVELAKTSHITPQLIALNSVPRR